MGWVREQDLALALGLVEAGLNVDLVGSRGSGRTAFLNELARRLEERGHIIVKVRGIASLQQNPLAALQLAGIQGNAEARTSALVATSRALRDALAVPRAVLLLDDWDDLDEASWGVLESVRRARSVPTVLSRLLGRSARHTPTGLDASSIEPSYVVELAPLPFDQLESAIVEVLGGPVEGDTMSRIYGKSGGVLGLAISLVEAAARDGSIAQVDGQWLARKDFWSPALRGILESYIENLPDDARDALEIIALVGLVDVSTIRRVVDWSTIELLEQRALVRLVVAGPRRLITVIPPLLVEFFRHEPLAARRLRLTELVEERLGSDESAAVALVDLGMANTQGRTADALFARLSRERIRTRQIVTRAAWQQRPGPHTARDYILSILHDTGSDELIEQVFARTDLGLGDARSRAEFAMLRAMWLAFVRHDVAAALAELEEQKGGLGAYGRMLDAQAVYIRTHEGQIPGDYPALLEIDEQLPLPVRIHLAEVQMFVLVVLGLTSDARRVFTYLEAQPEDLSVNARTLEIYLLAAEGRIALAFTKAMRGLDDSYGLLDAHGVRSFGSMALMCMLLSGNHSRSESVLATVLAAGDLPVLPPGLSRGLQSIASILAFRHGNTVSAERLASQVRCSEDEHDGPLPGQSEGLARAQEVAFEGDAPGAAESLWESSEQLWQRGARYAGALGFLASLDVVWDDERYALCEQRVAHLDIPLVRSQLDYLAAARDEDPVALGDVALRLQTVGRWGIAASALEQGAALHRSAGELAEAAVLDRRLEELYRAADTGTLDTARFATVAVNLSDREREVARLVAGGLTNAEIATRLVLSVRTVESHLHRIMRKLGVGSRRELRRYVEGSPLI